LAPTGKSPYSTRGSLRKLCQQLLFKGNVDQIVIHDHSELGAKVGTKIGTTDNVYFSRNCESALSPDPGLHVA
jgi:hypothetical protein